MFVIVRKNNIGIYGEPDPIDFELYDSEEKALSRIVEIQPMHFETKLDVAEVV